MNETLDSSLAQEDNNSGSWNDLANLSKTWEEHLQEANDLASNNEGYDNSWGVHVFDDDYDANITLSDDELLARDIDSTIKDRKVERIRKERIQERFERELIENMTDIDELEMMANIGVEGLSSEELQYDKKNIKIIYATGYPLRFLKSNISNNDIADNPEKWTRDDTEYRALAAKQSGDYHFLSGKDGTSLANTICTSYIDTDINPEQASTSANGITYIFTRIRPNSVIDAAPNDAMSDAADGDRLSKLDEDMTPYRVAKESKGDWSSYNEVTLKRYDETGRPLLPTALLVNEMNDVKNNKKILKVAAFYGIPIIQVMRASYPESNKPSGNSDQLTAVQSEFI